MSYCIRLIHLAGIVIISLLALAGCGTPGNSKMPILVLASDENFGSYTTEILRAEGFNEFNLDTLGGKNFTSSGLMEYDMIILGQQIVSQEQSDMLASYVKDGGHLIAFRPDKKLSSVFGIADSGGTVNEGYISIDATTPAGKGLISDPLQYHGMADKYSLKGASAIAGLFSEKASSTGLPAVAMNVFGEGLAIAFLYNLPESIVLTRQGNYRNAGKEMDGITGIRAMDLFTDGWVDTSKNILNQADEQMRLLTRCIETMSDRAKPLPRFWYFPDSLKCVVTLNNDGEDSREAEFTPQFEDVDAKGAKMTLYIKETDFVSKEWVDRWTKKGFEISGHPDDTRQAENPDWNTMDSVIRDLKSQLNNKYGIAEMFTTTNHWFVWVGAHASGDMEFAAQAMIQENNGIGLDCNYAHYDNNSNQGHFLGAMGLNQGNYTGSGLTMKFADSKGKTINVYQQLNNVYDQQYMEHKDQDGYFNAFKGLMDRSLENEVYSYISARAHNNEYYFSKIPLMKALDYANSKNVPVWTEVKLLEFLKAKDEATFTDLNWKDDALTFKIKSTQTHSHGISFIIPAAYNGKKIRAMTSNGKPQQFTERSIKGVQYAMATFEPGADYEFKISYIN